MIFYDTSTIYSFYFTQMKNRFYNTDNISINLIEVRNKSDLTQNHLNITY
jgi:hypothetical protein